MEMMLPRDKNSFEKKEPKIHTRGRRRRRKDKSGGKSWLRDMQRDEETLPLEGQWAKNGVDFKRKLAKCKYEGFFLRHASDSGC